MDAKQALERPAPVAELVLENGRLAGTRRSLQGPLTFIGHAAACDLRLDVDGLNPLHCLIARQGAQFIVRDLETASGTFVNGERISAGQLQHEDLLTLGLVQFRFIVQDDPADPEAAGAPSRAFAVEAQQDALRIQAAAVAAQQAALLEEESRLQHQQGALTQQQEQLATHLEDKRQRLLQLSDQVQATRAALHRDREELDRQAARQAEELTARQLVLEGERKKLHEERLSANKLVHRLKLRFQRRAAAERQQIRQREAEAAAEGKRLIQEWEKLKQEREALTQSRLVYNGNAELGKRQLQAEWQKLWHEQKLWKQDREQKETDLAARARTLRQREQALGDAERALGDDRHQWEQKRKIVEQEVHGLEGRLNNQRRKLNELQAELARTGAKMSEVKGEPLPLGILVENDPRYLEPAGAALAKTPEEAHLRELEAQINGRVAFLERVAEDLADQRLELVEHWQRVALTQQEWSQAHAAAADQMQALAARLPQQEEALLARQDALEAAEDNLRQRRHELSRLRLHLEGWAARVRLREASWESEHDRLLADLQGREALANKHLEATVALRQRWAKRRRQELELLRGERGACEKLRQELETIRQDYWKRGLALDQQQRDLSEKTLALEEYRQQFILRSHDASGVENKLERIRKRWVQEHAAAARATSEQYKRLQDESAQLQQRGRELLKVAEELATREANLAQRQVAWEEQLTQAEAQHGRLRQQLQSAQVHRERGERLAAELQTEVERLARLLLDEVEAAPAVSLAQAA